MTLVAIIIIIHNYNYLQRGTLQIFIIRDSLAKYSENPEVISIMSTLNLLAFLLGGLAGLCMEEISIYLINKRVTEPITLKLSGSIGKSLSWIAAGAFSWFFVVYINGLNLKTVEILLLLSVCIVLSVVDITIRKIPNALVLLALVTGYVFRYYTAIIRILNSSCSGFYRSCRVYASHVFRKACRNGRCQVRRSGGVLFGSVRLSYLDDSDERRARSIYNIPLRYGQRYGKIENRAGSVSRVRFCFRYTLKMLNENYTFLDFIMNRLYLG